MQNDNTLADISVADRVQAELDRQLLDSASSTSVLIPVSAILLVVLLQPHVPLVPLLVWMLVMLLISAARLFIALRYRRSDPADVLHRSPGRQYVVLTGLTGVAWSVLALLPHVLSTPFTLAVVYLTAVGVIMIGTYVLYPSRLALMFYVCPLPAVLVLAWYSRAGVSEWSRELGVLLITGLLFMVWVGLRNHRIMKNSLTLRFVNEELVARLQRSSKEAQAASEAKSFFLANMSHEIRTPMNAVIGLARLLQATSLDARQTELLGAIQTATDSLLALLNNTLDLSRIEAGQLQLVESTFSLPDFLDSVRVTMEPLARQKRIDLKIDADPEQLPRLVHGDEIRLRQVLINLVSNAIKFTSQGSVIVRVSATSPAEKGGLVLLFSVIDTGIGIPADKHGVIFGNFTQADISTTRQYGGSGLGLAISKQLIELMGGTIWLNSEPGKGAAFFFTVTLRPGEAAVRHSWVSLDAGPQQSLQVLVVEDNDINRFITRELLESRGHLVGEARNGLAGLQAIATEPCDMVLMDVQMPVMDGMTATRVIRSIEVGQALPAELPAGLADELRTRLGGGHLPVIAVTANEMLDDRNACMTAGMDRYLVKPFRPEQLYEVVEQK